MEATGAAGGAPAEKMGVFWRRWLGADAAGGPPLALANVLWYFGAISGVVAAIAIVDRIPQSHRDLWEFLASLGFFAVFALSAWLLTGTVGQLPGGLAAGMAAAMVPAVGYGLTQLVHVYPRGSAFSPFQSFSGAIFAIALATLVAAVLAWAVTGIAINLGLASVVTLFAAQLLATAWHPGLDGRATTALVTGLLLVAAAVVFDAAGRRGAAFWPYVGGLSAATGALVVYAYPSRHYGVWIAFLVIGTLLLVGFPYVGRRTWVVFGTVDLVAAFTVAQLSTDGRGGRAVVIGAVVVAAALFLDLTAHRREAFWLYIGGLSALAEGLIYLAVRSPDSEPWISMLAIGAALLALFVWTGRKTFAVFGAAGVAGAYATAELASGDGRAGRALIVAAVVFGVGFFADTRRERLTGFWLQLGGLLGVTAALLYLVVRSTDPTGRGWTPMLIIGAILLLAAAFQQRRMWVAFGAAGVAAAFGHYLVTQSGWFRYVLLAIAFVAFAGGIVADRARRQMSA